MSHCLEGSTPLFKPSPGHKRDIDFPSPCCIYRFLATLKPYRGVAAGAMNDLLAGRLDAMFNTTGSLLQSVRAGQVRALAISSARRAQNAPDIPTFAESGVPGYAVQSWYGVFVPAKTPPEIVNKMQADVAAALADPAVQARFEPLGVTVASSTPQELAARMKAEAELWGPIIKAANIRGE